jgi:cytochrome P450
MKVGSDILIDLIDNELIAEYYQKTKERYYQKDMNSPGFSAIKSIIGKGLFLSEGDAWKKKKKILSKIFNHEFIYSLIPAISEIAEQNFKAL